MLARTSRRQTAIDSSLASRLTVAVGVGIRWRALAAAALLWLALGAALPGGSAVGPALASAGSSPPTVTGVNPSSGPETGGTSVSITGMNLTSTPTPLTATAELSIAVTQPTYTASISSYEAEGKEFTFSEPNAVAVDPSGNIWVADSASDRVVEFSPERKFVRQFGKEGSGEGQFKGIAGIATNASGDVYAVDPGNHRVQEFGPSGEHLRTFGSLGSGEGQFIIPSALAVDSHGNVWVLNSSLGLQVEEFSPEGKYISGFGSAGPSEAPLLSPTSLAFSGANLYATEEGHERVVELSSTGAVLKQFGSEGSGNGQFYKPSGITADPATGNLYVSELGTIQARFTAIPPSLVFEPTNNRIQELSPQGAFITAFGSAGSGAGQLSSPRGVAVSSSGTVFVADTGNKRLQEWGQAP
jgi:DNA-binding beta-propeller fold protein YncE